MTTPLKKPLFKTTVIFYTEEDPAGTEYGEIQREIIELGGYVQKFVTISMDCASTPSEFEAADFFAAVD
jgi:hypothetical protein